MRIGLVFTIRATSHLTISMRELRATGKFKRIIDDSAKRGGWPTSELFTEDLCGPNFAVS